MARPELGVIEPGAPADLLILDENPMKDPSALAHPYAVIRGGRLLRSDPEPPGFLRTARVAFALLSGLLWGGPD